MAYKDSIINILDELNLLYSKIIENDSIIYIEIYIENVDFLPKFIKLFSKKVTQNYLAIEAFMSEEKELTIKISLK